MEKEKSNNHIKIFTDSNTIEANENLRKETKQKGDYQTVTRNCCCKTQFLLFQVLNKALFQDLLQAPFQSQVPSSSLSSSL